MKIDKDNEGRERKSIRRGKKKDNGGTKTEEDLTRKKAMSED